MVDCFTIDPWKVKVKGLVNNPKDYDFDDLVRRFPLEERLYRMRCVEAWAMAVPWTGFPISALIKEVDPKPEARYMRMVTAYRLGEMPGIWSQPHYPWPCFEALRLERGHERAGHLRYGSLWQAPAQTKRSADPADDPLEMWVEEYQVDRRDRVYAKAAAVAVESGWRHRIRLLFERES